MTDTKPTLREAIWSDTDPYTLTTLLPRDLQGWRTQHPILTEAAKRASLMAEVGVWKGAGVVDMVLASPGAEVLAVDTFRGSTEHWLNDKWVPFAKSGFLYDQFKSNIYHTGLTEVVTPLPMDSINASCLCAAKGLVFDLVHIDGAHDFESVLLDLRHWCGLARVIVMDDYCDEWPEVVRAVDTFCKHSGWSVAESLDGKCRLEYSDDRKES
jgi:hypothetical protein